MQTPLDALVVAFEQLGNLFIMFEKEAPSKCVAHQWLMTGGLYRTTPFCSHMMLQEALSGVVSEDALSACVAQKRNRGSNGCSSCMCRTEMIFCQQIQVQGCCRDHSGATVNKVQQSNLLLQ